MKIWLLEEGKKTGPHEVYTVRDRISNGEVTGETPAWHEGLDNWVTLAEVPTYRFYFSNSKSDDYPEEEENDLTKSPAEFIQDLEDRAEEKSSPERVQGSAHGQHEPLHAVRRFFARCIDIWIYIALSLLIQIKMGVNPFAPSNAFNTLMLQLPYIVVDALAMAYLGTTPGKWLLEIRLRRPDGGKLLLDTAIIRSARVWILGFAMGSIFAAITIPFSWFIAGKYGKFIWDVPKNNITECKPLQPLKIILYVAIFFITSSLLQYGTPAEYMPTMDNLKF